MGTRIWKRKNPYNLRTVIILLVCTVVLIALLCTGMLVAYDYAKSTKASLEDKAWTIATSFARSPVVIEGLQAERTQDELQAYADEVQTETGVDYIVVMNMNRVRLTHPLEEQIGRQFVGDDVSPAFGGQTYTSTAEGTLGESLRAFIPVTNEVGDQVGVVAVGILTDNINDAVYRSQLMVWLGGVLGIIPAILGAILLAKKVKKSMHDLEPVEITQLLETREAILSSVQEGIIVVDAEGKVIVCNATALDLLHKTGKTTEPLHQPIADILPEFELHEVLKTGDIKRNQPMKLQDYELVVTRVPVSSNGVQLGAMATFQDTTELALALDQLSGIKSYAESLSSHTHEFMNKLHVVSAMVHTESYDELRDYIKTISTYYQEDVGWMSRHLKDPVLVGYMLNKLNVLKRKGIQVTFSGQTAWPVVKDTKYTNVIITVIGNSLDNAAEALESSSNPKIEITMDVRLGEIIWQLKDNGLTVTQSELDNLRQKGQSTKGSKRGFGLYLMQSSLEELNGRLDIQANDDLGVTLRAALPIEGDNHDKRINS
ncbi:DcuS/MalK family sensor histidine kinase [Alkalicoccobacillus porphyridii]|uniref:DcuS/MalK family sensor histidine kinase n=1 Tax=Alkalicoccobacillus porphyridii TaxID=2597270 RepID=UPI00163DC1D3|nr:DcuS/MalK family sensor histidine kinase [Alkalicoccobacillus porphyridii]